MLNRYAFLDDPSILGKSHLELVSIGKGDFGKKFKLVDGTVDYYQNRLMTDSHAKSLLDLWPVVRHTPLMLLYVGNGVYLILDGQHRICAISEILQPEKPIEMHAVVFFSEKDLPKALEKYPTAVSSFVTVLNMAARPFKVVDEMFTNWITSTWNNVTNLRGLQHLCTWGKTAGTQFKWSEVARGAYLASREKHVQVISGPSQKRILAKWNSVDAAFVQGKLDALVWWSDIYQKAQAVWQKTPRAKKVDFSAFSSANFLTAAFMLYQENHVRKDSKGNSLLKADRFKSLYQDVAFLESCRKLVLYSSLMDVLVLLLKQMNYHKSEQDSVTILGYSDPETLLAYLCGLKAMNKKH